MAPRELPIEIKVATRELLAQREGEGELRIELLAEVASFLKVRLVECDDRHTTMRPEAPLPGEKTPEEMAKFYQDELLQVNARRLGVRLMTDAESGSGLR